MTRISFPQIPSDVIDCMMQTENCVSALTFIDKKTQGLMKVYVSALNECAYCLDMHHKEAIAAGETELRLYSVALWRDTNYYTAAEQALLEWAKCNTILQNNSAQLDDTFTSMSVHYSRDEIAKLTLAVVQINAWNRLAKSFGFEAGKYKVKT